MTTLYKLPRMDDPQGRGWRQPANLRDIVQVYETHVVIPERVFFELSNYEASYPSGVYPGKVWRHGRKWLRRWGPDRNGKCKCGLLRVLLV